MIMAEERLICEHRFLRPLDHNSEIEVNLLELRKLQYYQRFGLKIIPTRLRIHASKEKTETGNHYQVINSGQKLLCS